MKDTKEHFYEVVKHIGNIAQSNTYTKELNIISWNGRQPVYDLRGFRVNKDGIKYPLKGISLNTKDLIALKNLLLTIDLGV